MKGEERGRVEAGRSRSRRSRRSKGRPKRTANDGDEWVEHQQDKMRTSRDGLLPLFVPFLRRSQTCSVPHFFVPLLLLSRFCFVAKGKGRFRFSVHGSCIS